MTIATRKIALTAVFSALSVVLTLVSVPLPGGGYYNFGDVPVFAATATLGPILGALVGALGGALGDLCLGYTLYAPFSLIIKAVEALIAGAIFGALRKTLAKDVGRAKKTAACFASCLAGGVVMAAGYFLAEGLLLAEGRWQGGIVNLPWNVLQGAVSAMLASVLLFPFRIETAIEKVLYGSGKRDGDGGKDYGGAKSDGSEEESGEDEGKNERGDGKNAR